MNLLLNNEKPERFIISYMRTAYYIILVDITFNCYNFNSYTLLTIDINL